MGVQVFSRLRMSPRRGRVAWAILIALGLVAAAFAAPPRGGAEGGVILAAAALSPHAPIDIESDSNFTAANGVVSGTGTPADPYVIEGWAITAPSSIGVQIRNTRSHVVFRDIAVTAAPLAGFYVFAATNVTLSNVTAYAGVGDGVRVESSRHVTVEASYLEANNNGATVLGSSFVTISRNEIALNIADGVVVSASPSVTIARNNISLNGFGNAGYGVHLLGTTDDTVTANAFDENGIYLEGSVPGEVDSHTITADNLVSGLPILYEPACANLALSGLALGGLLLANCQNASLSNATLALGDVGVEVAFSTSVTIGPNVTVTEAGIGIGVDRSSSIQIEDIEVHDSGFGVVITSSTDVRVSGSKVSSPTAVGPPRDGIAVRASDRVNLTRNVVRHQRAGVAAEGSGNVSLVATVSELNAVGLFAFQSRDLLIQGDLFVRDGRGLSLVSVTNVTVFGNAIMGSLTQGANVSMSTGVVVAHNRFSGNTANARDDQPAGNAWDADYPAGGNFWSNYRGSDNFSGPAQNIPGADGIGDTPYLFDVGARDRYPLMASTISADAPPDAYFFVTPPLGTVRTMFTASANLSSDYEDSLANLQVRWAWDDGGAWTPWTTTKTAQHMYATPGNHTVHLEVRDTAGLTDSWSWALPVYPKPDNLPPVIQSTPVASAEIGHPISIVANITDPTGIANATLLYKGVADAAFTAVPMESIGGTNYSATIPGQGATGTVEYVIVANDTWANEARAPLIGASTILIVDSLTPVIVVGVVLAAAAVVAALILLRRRRRRAPPSGDADGAPATLK